MGFFLILAMGIWTLFAFKIGRLVQSNTGNRRLASTAVIVIMLLPFVDILAGTVVGIIRLQQLSPIRLPAEMEISGVRSLKTFGGSPIESGSLPDGYGFLFLEKRPIEFIEVEYQKAPPWGHRLNPDLGPGYYQYWPPQSSLACPEDRNSRGSDSHYRLRSYCFYITRTDHAMARYAYEFRIEGSPVWWPWSNPKLHCNRLTNLSTGVDVARQCRAIITWWVGEGTVLLLPAFSGKWSPKDLFNE